jgi:hypothetical protein
MLLEQKHRCALCRQPFGDTSILKPIVDHNHTTGRIRALLHKTCNFMLGIIEKRGFRRNAERYLSEQRAKVQGYRRLG